MTYIGLALIAVGVGLVVWRFFTNPVERTLRIYYIVSILEKMDRRLNKLVTIAGLEKIDWRKFQDTCGKIIKLVKISAPKVVVSFDEAKAELERAEKELSDKYFKKKEPLQKRISFIRSISRLLDADGFGLAKLRRSDRLYTNMKSVEARYFDEYKHVVDRPLKALIELHVDFSEASANAELFRYRLNQLKADMESLGISDIFSPSGQADLEGLGDDMEKIKRGIRVDIGQYLGKIIRKKQSEKP